MRIRRKENHANEYLVRDAQILGLPQPMLMSNVFDFTLQRKINK